jgi:hypothetical protein
MKSIATTLLLVIGVEIVVICDLIIRAARP